MLMLLASFGHAQESLLSPTEPASSSAFSAPPSLTKEQLAAINAEVRALQKRESLGDLLYFAGYLAWIPLLIDDNPVTFTAFLVLWGAHEAGLGMSFLANRRLRGIYREIGGEESFLRYGGQGSYMFTRVLTFGGAGILALGALQGDDDMIVLGSAGVFLGEVFSFPVWRALRNSNREVSSGIRNWNLNAGLAPGAGARLALVRRF